MNILDDVNGKPSLTRNVVKYASIFAIICCYSYGFLSILTGKDLGEQSAFVIIALNTVLIGGGFGKMSIEHYKNNKKKNDK